MATRTQTLVQLTDELREQLDRRATRDGVSRSRLIRDLLEQALAEELTDHLGDEVGDPAGNGSGNSRNGYTPRAC